MKNLTAVTSQYEYTCVHDCVFATVCVILSVLYDCVCNCVCCVSVIVFVLYDCVCNCLCCASVILRSLVSCQQQEVKELLRRQLMWIEVRIKLRRSECRQGLWVFIYLNSHNALPVFI